MIEERFMLALESRGGSTLGGMECGVKHKHSGIGRGGAEQR
jgi:hypothetical protein